MSKETVEQEPIGKIISGAMLRNHVDTIPGIKEETLIELKTDCFYPNSIPVYLFRNMLRLLAIDISVAEPAMYATFEILNEKRNKGELGERNQWSDLWENKESFGKYVTHLKEIWNEGIAALFNPEQRTDDELWEGVEETIRTSIGLDPYRSNKIVDYLKNKYSISLKSSGVEKQGEVGEKTIGELLDEIDHKAMRLEDTLHGEEGKLITEIRKHLLDILKLEFKAASSLNQRARKK